MKLWYAIQPAFYDIMKQSGNIQALLEGMDEQQRSRIQIPIEMQSLQESAEAFFQKEIECRKDCLSYDHFLKSRVYVVYIREGAACMEDCTNPFYQLLKRKYRCLLVQEVDK